MTQSITLKTYLFCFFYSELKVAAAGSFFLNIPRSVLQFIFFPPKAKIGEIYFHFYPDFKSRTMKLLQQHPLHFK